MEEAALAPSFGDLPLALQLHVLSFLPLVERVRCALLSRGSAPLLGDPAFWVELSFVGAAEGAIDDATLLHFMRRSQGRRLRALDISAPACDGVTLGGLCQALASDGLGLALTTLRTWAPGGRRGRPITEQFAAALAQACPALTSAAVEVQESTLAAASALLNALPEPGGKLVTLTYSSPERRSSDVTGWARWPDLADWAATALPAASAEEFNLEAFHLQGDDEEYGADLSAERFTKALAAPGERGLRVLRCTDVCRLGGTQLLHCLCHALTAESPLTELHLSAGGITGAEAAAVAAALAPGRSRLRTLSLESANLTNHGGGMALFASLGANETLTELSVKKSRLGGFNAAATLAASLRSNAALRVLKLDASAFKGAEPGGMALILGALGPSSAESPPGSSLSPPRCCGLTHLDISGASVDSPACISLGQSLASGARLEILIASDCEIGPEGAVAIAEGLAAAGPASRLRSLDLSKNLIGPEGGEAFGRVLARCACPLERLVMNGCAVGDAGGSAIAHALEAAGGASRLYLLGLGENHLDDGAAEALGRALAAQGPCGALRTLFLAQNWFGPAAALSIAEGLGANATLETLRLDYCGQIGVEGAAAIAGGISSSAGGCSSAVTTLSLAGVRFGSAGVEAMLAAGLGRNETLTRLDVSSNFLTDAGCLALARWGAARFGVAPPELDDGGGSRNTSEESVEAAQQQQPPASRCRFRRLTIDANLNGGRTEAAGRAAQRCMERANAAASAARAAALAGGAWARKEELVFIGMM